MHLVPHSWFCLMFARAPWRQSISTIARRSGAMESDSMRNSIQGDLRNMIRNMIRVGISCGAIALASCNAPSASNPATPTSSDLAASPAIANASDRLQVVATTSVLCDLTRQIAAEALAAQSLDLTCLMQPGEDPHIYRTTPADRRAIETADLVLYGGYNFDVGPISVLQATTGDAPKIAVYEVAVPQPLLGSPHSHSHGEDHADTDHDHAGADHDHADEAAGHNEPAPDHADAAQSGAEVPDPHVWHDARNGAAIAQVIGDALTQVDPEQGDRYRQATEAIVTQLQAIHNWIGQQTTTIPTPARQLVTTHDAFRYFATAYDLTVRGTLSGLSTAERPTATELAKLVDRLKADQVPAIFAESTDSNQWIQTLAQDANVAIAPDPLFVEGPGDTNSIAPTYQTMLVANTCAIVAGLGGKCDPATAPSAIDP